MVQTLAFRRFVRLTGENRAGRLDIPRRFVRGLIELGPTFVKIGQILSTRPDLLPEEYVAELKILHEAVPGFKTGLVRDIIASELGPGMEDVFVDFAARPVASASLSQVHFAVLKDESEVAVKVQRPGIRDTVDGDMDILSWLARLFSRVFPRTSHRLNIVSVFREFDRFTRQELGFTLEGKTMERFSHNFSQWDDK